MSSKIGIHALMGPRTGFGDFVKRIAAAGQTLALVKCVDDFGAAFDAKQANPQTLTIGRMNEGPQHSEDLQAFEPRNYPSAQAAAAAYYKIVKPYWLINKRVIDVWESFNEYSGNWSWQADFYIALMDLAEVNDFRLGLWSCSGGNPPLPPETIFGKILAVFSIGEQPWEAVARACARAKAHGHHILCLHEYAWDGLLKDSLNNGVVMRYRPTHDYLKSKNADIPIALTEYGENGGGGFVGKKKFINDLAAMDQLLMQDDYILGVAAWTLGQWSGANFQTALPALADYIIRSPAPAPVPVPTPIPPPPPAPVPPPPPPIIVPPTSVQYGLHDIGGAEYMRIRGLTGCAVVLVTVQDRPVQIDLMKYAMAGITIIVRIGYGYADGSGTLPAPDRLAAFEAAVVSTIKTAKGVAYWQYGNEPNNRSEWPTGFNLTPVYYVESYNRVWSKVPVADLMGPAPIDPYFGPGSNNRDWWIYILARIKGADVLFLHAKTQTNDFTEVMSAMKFSDDPLKWQFLHFRTIETSLEVVPSNLKAKPVFISEANPQRLTSTHMGWSATNGDWIRQVKQYVKAWNATSAHQKIGGVVFYRWADDDWILSNKAALLAAAFE